MEKKGIHASEDMLGEKTLTSIPNGGVCISIEALRANQKAIKRKT